MGNFEKALSRFQEQKAGALARSEARKKAQRIKKRRKEGMERKQEAKKQLRDEQPARMDAYVAAVAAWCNTPRRRRNRTPSPRAADFGILNELKAIAYLFKNLTIEY